MAKDKYFFVFPKGDKYMIYPREATSFVIAIEAFREEHPEYFHYGLNKMYSINIGKNNSKKEKI